MKLGEPKKQKLGLKAREVLAVQEPHSPFYEDTGLPQLFQEKFLHFLSVDQGNREDLARDQLEYAVALMTLYPEQTARIRAELKTNKMFSIGWSINSALLMGGWSQRDDTNLTENIHALALVKMFNPEYVPTMRDSVFPIVEKKLPAKYGYAANFKTAGFCITIFPERAEEVRKIIGPIKPPTIQAVKGKPDADLYRMFYTLLVDPHSHPELHAFVVEHRAEYKNFFRKKHNRMSEKSAMRIAIYKLLLADEIERLPSGQLVAIEKTTVGQTQPLPPRSTLE